MTISFSQEAGPQDVFFAADFHGRQPRKIDRGRDIYDVSAASSGQTKRLNLK